MTGGFNFNLDALLRTFAAFDVRALPVSILVWPLMLGLGLSLLLQVQPVGRPRTNLRERLRRLDVDERIRSELGRRNAQTPLFASAMLEGLLRPVLDDIGRATRALLTRFGLGGGRDLDRKLYMVRPGIEPVQLFGEKVACGLVGLAFFPMLNAVDLTLLGPWPVWLWAIALALGFFAPDWQLEARLRTRRTQVVMELPTILDMLTIAASAGLALEQALVHVSRESEGAVARELQRVSREMALGQATLSEALVELANRNDVAELTSVVHHLHAVHEQGLPLVQALATQAEALRERQRVRILEEGGKAGVRMLLPVALFILPVLFVVVLVPAGVELTRLGG